MPLRGVLALIILLGTYEAQASTLPPELKAYDFGEAYYIEDGGVVISPYTHGFYCPEGTLTPEGIRVMPGQRFIQFNSDRKLEQEFYLVRISDDGSRAFFYEWIYRYEMGREKSRRESHPVRQKLVETDAFYLSRFRGLEWFDHVFANVEIHPGAWEWSVSKN